MSASTVATWVVIRCRWCNKPQFDAQTVAAVFRFRCSDRGCRMSNTITVDGFGSRV